MSSRLPEIDLSKLTVDEKMDLIGQIWDSIPDNELPVQPWHMEIVRERLAEAKRNPGSGIPWDEVMRELRSRK